VPLLQDMARVMKSVESLDGLTHSVTGSHIFWTLDDTNGLVFARYGHGGTEMGKNPTPWALHPKTIMHWMEDVALVDGWMTCRDDIHPPPPWTPSFTPWTLGLLMMTSC
jgi:hypothetical protein